jgi:hypothetical protein
LRDIYVFGTTVAEWARFLRFVREAYRIEFLVALKPQAIHETLA